MRWLSNFTCGLEYSAASDLPIYLFEKAHNAASTLTSVVATFNLICLRFPSSLVGIRHSTATHFKGENSHSTQEQINTGSFGPPPKCSLLGCCVNNLPTSAYFHVYRNRLELCGLSLLLFHLPYHRGIR